MDNVNANRADRKADGAGDALNANIQEGSMAAFYVWSNKGSFWMGSKTRLSNEYPDRLSVGTWTAATKELRKARTYFPELEWQISKEAK